MKLYTLLAQGGRDVYDHSNKIIQIGNEHSVNREYINKKLEAYIEHCQRRVDCREYAWAEVCLITSTPDGAKIERCFVGYNALKERIKLNEQAKDAPPPEIEKPKKAKTAFMDPNYVWGTAGMLAGVLPDAPVQMQENEELL